MQTNYLGGPPRVDAERLSIKRTISIGQPPLLYISKRIVIDGAKTRDSGNTPTDAIRPGVMFGKVSATGRYAPSFLGVSQNAYASGGLAITVTPAQAAEIIRRKGASGTLNYIGPPAAAGVVVILGPIAYSAIDPITGIITTATLGANLIAGGLVADTDGSQLPVFPFGETDGIKMTDRDGLSQNQDYWPPCSGGLDWNQMLPLATDTSLIAWIKLQMRTYCFYTWNNDF